MPCEPHASHAHVHGPGCGHVAVQHDDHVDYLHDGHLHHPHEHHIDEHVIEVGPDHPDTCDGGHSCRGHKETHVHGHGCGHEAVPHGDHTDYLVEGHLHHPHEGHCDLHGSVAASA
jgi:hypothetical protein